MTLATTLWGAVRRRVPARVVARLRGHRPPVKPEPSPDDYYYLGRHATYQAAAAVCGPYEQETVLQAKIADFGTERTGSQKLDEREKGVVAAVMQAGWETAPHRQPDQPFNLVDFGGALGIHFRLLRTVSPLPMTTTVVETEGMVRAGTEIWSGTEHIQFTSDLDQAGAGREIDLLLAIGAVQYTDDPYGYLTRMKARAPRFIFFDRLPFVADAEDYVSVAHVPAWIYGVAYRVPAWFMSAEKFRRFWAADYEVVFEYPVPQDAAVVDGEVVISAYHAMFLRRREPLSAGT